MVLSVGGVTSLFSWALYRVLSYRPQPEKLHGFNIDTHDTDEG
mgnify:FL=1|jgi:hypothetical protein